MNNFISFKTNYYYEKEIIVSSIEKGFYKKLYPKSKVTCIINAIKYQVTVYVDDTQLDKIFDIVSYDIEKQEIVFNTREEAMDFYYYVKDPLQQVNKDLVICVILLVLFMLGLFFLYIVSNN